MSDLNKGYAAAWKKIRKTRLKKTGMTEFFQAIDQQFRGYERKAFVAQVCKAADWKAQETTFVKTLSGFRDKFKALHKARDGEWTPAESRFLSAFHSSLIEEVIAWGEPRVSAEMASREFDRSDDGKAHQLSLLVKEAQSAKAQLGRVCIDVQGSMAQLDAKFKQLLGPTAYRQYLDTLKEARASLVAELRTADPVRAALNKQIQAVGRDASRESRDMLGALVEAIRIGMLLAQQSMAKQADGNAALKRFVDGWELLQRSVIAPRSKLAAQLDEAIAKVTLLSKARSTLGFKTGVRPEAAALGTFKTLCTALPAASLRLDAAGKAIADFAGALKEADDRDLGAMVPGQRSPFVVAAKKELLAWTESRAKARTELKELESFVQTWQGLTQAQPSAAVTRA